MVAVLTRKARDVDAVFGEDASAAIVARLQKLPEDFVLNYFWRMVARFDTRMDVLQQVGRVHLQRPADWSPKAVRAEFEAQHIRVVDPRCSRLCFACYGAQRRVYSHHVIEVYHGGSNTLRNLVPLCFGCHQFLHPWLKDEPAPRYTPGLEMAGLILPRVIPEDVLERIDEGNR